MFFTWTFLRLSPDCQITTHFLAGIFVDGLRLAGFEKSMWRGLGFTEP